MTKRHFEAIAQAVRTSDAFRSDAERIVFAGDLGVALHAANERFDIERFGKACVREQGKSLPAYLESPEAGKPPRSPKGMPVRTWHPDVAPTDEACEREQQEALNPRSRVRPSHAG